MGHHVEDIGNISVKQPEEMPVGEKRAKYIDEITDACKDLGTAVQKSLEEGSFPWFSAETILSPPDLSAALRLTSAKRKNYRLHLAGRSQRYEYARNFALRQCPWHAAFRIMGYGTEELHDLLGFKPKIEPQNVVLVGVRDLDAHEKKFIKKLGVKAFTMREIDERGMREVMSDALKYAMDDTDGIAVSLDMDFVDPSDAPGVGTPVRGGATYREAHLAMEMIADSEAMVSMEIVEINPVIDEHNRTALLGCRTSPLRPRQENPVSLSLLRDIDPRLVTAVTSRHLCFTSFCPACSPLDRHARHATVFGLR